MQRQSLSLLLALSLAAAVPEEASGQGPAFESPGMSTYFTRGQANRFSRDFNPALGVVLDAYGDYRDVDGGEDGADMQLRILELNASGFVDPKAWGWLALVSEDGEAPEVEEAAIQYIGFEGNSTIKAGRFFVDFGKQMMSHVEELRTLDRPLPLREYLGTELGGTGVQFDHWFAAGESPIRFSIGAFSNLLGEDHHGEEEEEEGAEAEVPDRKDFDELSFTARLTGMTDAGDQGRLQFGASARHVPEFSFAFEDDEVSGLSNTVVGFDGTYGWADETGQETFVTGFEFLELDGDLSAAVDTGTGTITAVNNDSASGFYAFAEYGWNGLHSVGIQYGDAESAEDPSVDLDELDIHYTRNLTEFRRLRFGVVTGTGEDGDFDQFYVQFTSFFGLHAHGVNW